MAMASQVRPVSAWPWIAVGLWLASAAAGFWYFQTRDARPFETDSMLEFDSGTRAEAAESWYRAAILPRIGAAPVTATVVHLYSEGCSCNRFTDRHLARIVARYRAQGVRFVAATRADGTTRLQHSIDLPQVTIPGQRNLDWLDSTPAALVYDSSGKLVYFGPYSNAAWCGTSGGLVERSLDRLLAGQKPRLQPFYSSGCFCRARHRVINE